VTHDDEDPPPPPRRRRRHDPPDEAEPAPAPASFAFFDVLGRNAKAITVIGVPALLASFLTWWLTAEVVGRLQRLEVAVARTEMRRQVDMARASAYLYALCLNTAQDDTDRARCTIANVAPDQP
jgi:hypothetical protein